MPQSFSQIYLHIIFSTKNRWPLLRDEAIRAELHSYLAATCNNNDCPAYIVGGVEDHIHIACRLGKATEVQKLIGELKRSSSLMMKGKGPQYKDFYWQNGYGAFSVSPGHLETLKTYIANQVEHHKKETFQEEYRRIMTQYGITWDERYVWE